MRLDEQMAFAGSKGSTCQWALLLESRGDGGWTLGVVTVEWWNHMLHSMLVCLTGPGASL